jgi:hypothetical protein
LIGSQLQLSEHQSRNGQLAYRAPLTVGENLLDSRFRRLGQAINSELGFRDQRLRFSKVTVRTGSTTWRLQNEHASPPSAESNLLCELATSEVDASSLLFSYNEEWTSTGGRNNPFRFKASNLKFVISDSTDERRDLQFRLEWVGAEAQGKEYVFPGKGAAHPHWQFDVESSWFEDGHAEEITIRLEPAEEMISLDGSALASEPAQISSTLSSFHRIHLPARAMWHKSMCVMPETAEPQQHSPESTDEIDRWFISAVRYVGHEFQAYM